MFPQNYTTFHFANERFQLCDFKSLDYFLWSEMSIQLIPRLTEEIICVICGTHKYAKMSLKVVTKQGTSTDL